MFQCLSKYTPALIGLLLVSSGLYKLVYPAEAIESLRSLEFTAGVATSAIVIVTVVEIYLGIILLLKANIRYALCLATCLMFLFTIFLSYLSMLAHPPSCGCMGLTALFRSNRQAAVFGLIRNTAILWMLKGAHDYYVKPEKGHVAPRTC